MLMESVWYGLRNSLDGCKLEKATGRDWIYDFCALAEKNSLRLYILAGKPGIAQTAATKSHQQYPDLQIVGHTLAIWKISAYLACWLKSTRPIPDVLLVGMGTPLQEKWLDCPPRSNRCAGLLGCWCALRLYCRGRNSRPRLAQPSQPRMALAFAGKSDWKMASLFNWKSNLSVSHLSSKAGVGFVICCCIHTRNLCHST